MKNVNTQRRNLLKYAGIFASIPFVNQMADTSKLLAVGIKNFSPDLIVNGEVYTAAHWGAIKVSVKNGKIIKSLNAFDFMAYNPLQTVTADLVDGKRTNRIKAPMVRKSFLENKIDNQELRGVDEWVEVSYEQAIKLVADEVARVRKERGASGIYGGSYGWKSSGSLHNARTLLHRYLSMGGGFVGGLGDYSAGAAQVIMPHVVGTLEVYEQQTSWPLIIEHSEVVVIWGANPIDTLRISWTSSDGMGLEYFEKLKKSNKQIIIIDPIISSTVDYFDKKAKWISPRPNTDVALMLGIMHTMLSTGEYDKEFIELYTEGFDKFAEYVMGKTQDQTPKDAKWASKISGVDEKTIKELARVFFKNRTMLMVGYNMQRQHHGEQVNWMIVTLACMIGQIGLAGGGFGMSYHYANGGSPTTNAPIIGGITIGKTDHSKTQWLSDGSSSSIPVARIADCLLHPGKTINYNGRKIVYPNIDLVYWVGGNPFVHHQDTNLFIKAWKKPSTVIVHDMYWTPTAKMADIVFPITTPYERNDLTMSGDYSNLNINPMKQVVPRMPKSKHDYEVFADLAKAGGFGEEFTQGNKSEMQWLEEFYSIAYEHAKKYGILMANGSEMPDFQTFWNQNRPLTFATTSESEEFVRYADFREDPILNPLGTPSGKIEIYSESIAKMGYKDCGPYPQWFEPIEWMGMKNKPAEFALISSHPSLRLHSQLSNTSLRDKYAVADREPVWINPDDAKEKGIKNGEIVRVFNARGQILAGAIVSHIVPKGVLRIYEGAWYDPQNLLEEGSLCKNGSVNVLTIDMPTSELADANIANTALVNIEKYKGKIPKLTAFLPPKGAK